MSIFKCKMCGGDLEVRSGATVCECEYCGSTQTTPNLDSEKKTNLFNRANRFRLDSEFDKASAIYASITAEFPKEAEAYWGLCLCKFGIEYVDDPLSGAKIPTCHRTLTTSILDDNDYSQAIQNADVISRPVYESEASRIDELQQDILRIVKSETPYDVFISYKETDENGDRTEDSVVAYDIYEMLTGKGLKVFFSRITLEDKLGQEYEPYIFAALQSAKVMLAVGTSYENLDAVWVKNEWSRFLEMMKSDRSKKLIPCFKNMEIDDLPKPFQRLQAQDISKLGWEQDLVRGVVKICGKQGTGVNEEKPVAVNNSTQKRNQDLLERAKIYIEDGLWENAEKYCKQYLRVSITDPEGYWTMLLIQKHAKNTEDLKKKGIVISDEEYFIKTIKYANTQEKAKYDAIDDEIRAAVKKRYEIYITDLKEKADKAGSMKEFNKILQDISGLYDFPEVRELKGYVVHKQEEYADIRYKEARSKAGDKQYEDAITLLTELGDYKDAKDLLKHFITADNNQKTYQEAVSLRENGQWNDAATVFRKLGDYRDSVKLAKQCERKAKKVQNSSVGQKFAIIAHMFFAVIVVVCIIAFNIDIQVDINKSAILTVACFIVIPIMVWMFDKRKTAKRIVLEIFVCVVDLILVAVLMKQNANNMTAIIITSLIALLSIVL